MWTAIVIGLGSGLAGAFIAWLFMTSNDRIAEERGRMTIAAEYFMRYSEGIRSIGPPAGEAAPAQRIDRLEAVRDDLASAVNLIDLIFGRDSKATHYARSAEVELLTALNIAELMQHAVDEHLQAASDALAGFAAEASRRIRSRWPSGHGARDSQGLREPTGAN